MKWTRFDCGEGTSTCGNEGTSRMIQGAREKDLPNTMGTMKQNQHLGLGTRQLQGAPVERTHTVVAQKRSFPGTSAEPPEPGEGIT